MEKDKSTGEMVRVALCHVTVQVLATCFDILGIQPVERM